MNELRAIFLDAATRILDDTPAQAERQPGKRSMIDNRTWLQLMGAGFSDALVPVEKEGAGLSFSDALPLVTLLATYATRVPLPEVMLANGVLAHHDLQRSGSFPILAFARPGETQPVLYKGRITGTLARVPWGRHASHFVIPAQVDGRTMLCLLARDTPNVLIKHGVNMAEEPRDTIILRNAETCDAKGFLFSENFLYQLSAVTRCAQITGALTRILDLTIEYASLRKQFGRPIGNFQAVQHMVTCLAAELVAAQAALDGGVEGLDAMSSGALEQDMLLATAAAKIRCGEAAGLSAILAHQVFGAIGFTKEHALETYTKRLWAWRDEYGNEVSWSERLGECLALKGAAGLWPMMTDAAHRIGSISNLKHV